MHKGGEVCCRVELIAGLKYNFVAYYKMGDKTVYNDGGRIPYAIVMLLVMMDVEGVNSEVSSEEIEE